MRLILPTNSSNEHDNADCDYALVSITKEEAELYLRRIELLKKLKQDDAGLYEMYYWDGFDCFESFDALDDFRDAETKKPFSAAVDGGNAFVLSLDEDADQSVETKAKEIARKARGMEVPEEALQRTECEQAIIREDGMLFMCYPKYADHMEIRSGDVLPDLLKKAAGLVPWEVHK